MLIRLIVDNFFSIAEEKSFDMLPNEKLSKLNHHKLRAAGIDLLKLGVLYGANAAGKSTLVKALAVLQHVITKGETISRYDLVHHRFGKERSRPITLGVEFISGETAYLYAIQFGENEVLAEELYRSGLGKKDDELIFSRSSGIEGHTVKFSKAFNAKKENEVLKSVLIKSIIKPDTPIFKLLTTLDVAELAPVTEALTWFTETLHVVNPKQNAIGLAYRMSVDKEFAAFSKSVIQAYHVGVKDIIVESTSIQDFFGKDDLDQINRLVTELKSRRNSFISSRTKAGEEVSIMMENGLPVVKQIKIIHSSQAGDQSFTMTEESDGTQRLFDFLPAFQKVTAEPKVFVIDEIESSIHPVLIKELVRKFSHDKNTQGQLIMTTHESNLLDQKLFRRDEIWFVEKDQFGATDLYSLNKFKEHHTIDIRKGYLNGRYGGIPFTGNLVDLNWHEYDTV